MMKFDLAIIGLAPQGLALLRTYSRAGYRVVAIGRRDEVGIHSRYGKIFIIDSFSEIHPLLETYLPDGMQVHITGDAFLNYLLENCPNLFVRCKVSPNRESAEVFRDKQSTAQLAKQQGVPVPLAVELKTVKPDEYNMFPSIIKWNRTYGRAAFKTALVHDHVELTQFLADQKKLDHLIIQHHVPGGFENDISYAGYWLAGREQCGICVKQKRQFPEGLSAYVEEYTGEYADILKEYAGRLLTATGHNGFAEVECKICETEKKLYLIEVNPRACGWIKILMADFDSYVLRKMGETDHGKKKSKQCWVNLVRDLRAIFQSLRTEFSPSFLLEVLQTYKARPTTDIFDIKDMLPFWLQFCKIFR